MEGKKSFVLYTDLIHTVKKLPKDKQADLFMMILEYVNDMNPSTEDLLVDVAFEPIKRQLKRDLMKYEERAERSRLNGKSGGRPPKEDNPKPRKPSGLSKNPNEPRKPDNVTVNDNVNDSVINKANIPLTVEDAASKFETAGVKGRYFSTISQIYNLNEKTVKDEFGKWKLKNKGENFNNEKHMRDSFNYWMRNYNPPRGSTEPTMNTLPVNNRKNRNPA